MTNITGNLGRLDKITFNLLTITFNCFWYLSKAINLDRLRIHCNGGH